MCPHNAQQDTPRHTQMKKLQEACARIEFASGCNWHHSWRRDSPVLPGTTIRHTIAFLPWRQKIMWKGHREIEWWMFIEWQRKMAASGFPSRYGKWVALHVHVFSFFWHDPNREVEKKEAPTSLTSFYLKLLDNWDLHGDTGREWQTRF